MILRLLALIGSSAVFTFVPTAPEGLAILYVEKIHWAPAAVALLCAFGQCLTFGALYLFGELLLAYSGWLRRHVEKVRVRYADHLEERFLVLSVFGGLLGVPPAIALSALAPGFEVPFRHLIPLFFVCRVARFSVMIFGGHHLNGCVHWI